MQQEGTYVLGALAATMSKTGIIGFVGGERYPNLINIYEGYRQGAQDVNPNVKVLVNYLDDWDNATKGKKAAVSQIDRGQTFYYMWLIPLAMVLLKLLKKEEFTPLVQSLTRIS